jgi:hypothetical protein
VEQAIAIGVGRETAVVGNLDATKNEPSALVEAVGINTLADSNSHQSLGVSWFGQPALLTGGEKLVAAAARFSGGLAPEPVALLLRVAPVIGTSR